MPVYARRDTSDARLTVRFFSMLTRGGERLLAGTKAVAECCRSGRCCQEDPTLRSSSETKNKPQNAESMETGGRREKSSGEVALLLRRRARDGRERDRALVKRCLSLSPHPGRSQNMHDSLGERESERERKRERDPSQQKSHSTLQSTFCYKKTPTYSSLEPINSQNLFCP